MCRPRIRPAAAVAAASAVVVLGTALGGCSDLYYARRDSMTLGSGDAVAANMAEQVVDPWPAQSSNKNIGFNGQKMQSAAERYRTNNVVQPTAPIGLEVASPQQPTTNQNGTQTAGSGQTTTTTTPSTTTTTTSAQ